MTAPVCPSAPEAAVHSGATRPLHVRWLGSVPYREAHALQRALFDAREDWLLLLEHPHVYTLGARADTTHVLVDPASVGAELVPTDRGGDVTYHGPGQLVGYPIMTVPGKRGGGMADTVAYVRSIEQLLVDTLADLGLPDAGRICEYPGVWIDPDGPNPRKIAAVGVRLARGRSMHGFALNVHPDMAMFDHIVPCGITDKAVTSLAAEGLDVTIREVVDAIVARAVAMWAPPAPLTDRTVEPEQRSRADSTQQFGRRPWDRADVVWRDGGGGDGDLAPFSRGAGAGAPVRSASDHCARSAAGGLVPAPAAGPTRGLAAVGSDGQRAAGSTLQGTTAAPEAVAVAGPSLRLRGRLAQAGVAGGLAVAERKPEWLRAPLRLGSELRAVEHTIRDLGLVTVCEEAGCPNRSECWADGTATFMVNGERCTRACGFCLVDTRRPEPLDPTEPERVAEAVERMGLAFAVVTTVARDDLPDEGAGAMAATVEAIHRRTPGVQVEVLISDCRGRPAALDTIFASRPEVLNHNVETVARLQRAVRPSAGYARSLSVLARARSAGLTAKSGLVVGMGETDDEIIATLADLAGVGVDIVTIGQYLRPTSHHLPVHRWVTPEQFGAYKAAGEAMGIAHVESSPLTRSSYHARQSSAAAEVASAPAAPST
jgi:lipoic acid synthetase